MFDWTILKYQRSTNGSAAAAAPAVERPLPPAVEATPVRVPAPEPLEPSTSRRRCARRACVLAELARAGPCRAAGSVMQAMPAMHDS
jgi:hypothetical protein